VQERREAKLKEELEKFRAENPKISEQFADLKRKLAGLAQADWEAIPEIGDYTVKKQKRMQAFTPVPDSLLARAAAGSDTASALDAATMAAGAQSSIGGATTDLTAIGAGRSTVVQLKLDRASDSVTGQTVVDPKGYLTDLKSVTLKSDAEISDIKKARLLLKSVISTNPKHAPGWIAAARLEEVAGRLAAARELAMKGCEMCPGSEDAWMEASRLQTPDNAKAVLARGVAALPDSVKLWMQAARLEGVDAARKRVLLRALERIPGSVRLWKAAVELSDEDDARVLLVSCLAVLLARGLGGFRVRRCACGARGVVGLQPALGGSLHSRRWGAHCAGALGRDPRGLHPACGTPRLHPAPSPRPRLRRSLARWSAARRTWSCGWRWRGWRATRTRKRCSTARARRCPPPPRCGSPRPSWRRRPAGRACPPRSSPAASARW
jgi:hypothetical protein